MINIISKRIENINNKEASSEIDPTLTINLKKYNSKKKKISKFKENKVKLDLKRMLKITQKYIYVTFRPFLI